MLQGFPSTGSFAELLTCKVRLPEQCSALCSPLRSSAVLMGRTLASKNDQMVHSESAFRPFLPGCLLTDPYLPEHHLNGGFSSFWPLLQAPCWVSVATKEFPESLLLVSVLWVHFKGSITYTNYAYPSGDPRSSMSCTTHNSFLFLVCLLLTTARRSRHTLHPSPQSPTANHPERLQPARS